MYSFSMLTLYVFPIISVNVLGRRCPLISVGVFAVY